MSARDDYSIERQIAQADPDLRHVISVYEFGSGHGITKVVGNR